MFIFKSQYCYIFIFEFYYFHCNFGSKLICLLFVYMRLMIRDFILRKLNLHYHGDNINNCHVLSTIVYRKTYKSAQSCMLLSLNSFFLRHYLPFSILSAFYDMFNMFKLNKYSRKMSFFFHSVY